MKNWHKITEQLAPINKSVFILKHDLTNIHTARLSIYDIKNPLINNNNDNHYPLIDGDIYWDNNQVKKHLWFHIKTYPYWLINKELVKLVIEPEDPIIDRSEILDI